MVRGLFVLVAVLSSSLAQETFTDIVKDYWAWRLKDAPEFATAIEVHTYDDKVEQYSIEVLDQRKAKIDGYLQRLGRLDKTDLSQEERISYDVLTDTLKTYQAGYKWKDYGPMNPVNFLEGLWNNPAATFPDDPKTYEAYLNYTTRLTGWANQADNLIKRMRRAMAQNTTSHWVSVERSLKEFDDVIGKSDNDNFLYNMLNKSVTESALTDTEKDDILKEGAKATGLLRRKYTSLKNFIETEYKNHTRKEFGVSSFKNGADYYKACLKWHLSTDITPEDVHELGLKEVKRIYGEMKEVLDRLKFSGTVNEFFKSLKNDSRFFLKTPAETIKRFEDIIFKRVKPQLPKFFKNIPNMPVKVEELPNDGPSSYAFGSPDGSRPGIFYANVRRPEDNPTYTMPSLVLHEANPGHHLQDIYSQASTEIPMFRRVIDYEKYFSIPMHFPFQTAYTEGWALYAESLGEKEYLDIYEDDYELLGRYSSEIFRACRLVVDTGLHYYGWPRQRAIDYILNYTAESEESTKVEIDRYITWPGQACAYKIGELKIKELRARAQEELGEAFDIRDFHSVVLDNGAVPLNVLENLVNDWIAMNLIAIKTDSLDKIMADYYAWRLKSSPEFSTGLSYKYNDKLDSYSYDKFYSQLVDAQRFLQRLYTTDRSKLEAEKQISYDVLENILQTFIDGYEWHDYGPLNPINFIGGWFGDVGRFMQGFPMDTQGDVINYIRRIEQAPAQLQEMIELSRKAIKNETTYNKVSVSRVAKQLDAISTPKPTESVLYKKYLENQQKVFGSESKAVDGRLLVAIGQFQEKIKEVKDFINTEYIPKTRTGLGVGSLKNGVEYYRACLKWHTSLDISPEDIHNRGLDEVKRISGLMKQTMKRLGYPESTSIHEAFKNMTSNHIYLLGSGSETLKRFREIIFQRIKPQITKYFKNAPDLPLEVRASVSDGIGGEYLDGAEDGSRPGIFYANVHRPEDNPTYTMVSLSLHEAIPGHHLAGSYGMVSSLPDFRKHMEWRAYNAPYFFPFFNSFVEGWALYAEYLGEEMGIYQDDSEMMGRYSDEMLRATRLVIDTGIHYYNWSHERAVNYMLKYTAESPDAATIEVDRYSTWPGQACGYKLGEMKIKELRQKATAALGSKFVLRDFHYTILKNGATPLNILEDIVDEWIESVKAEPSSSKCTTSTTAGTSSNKPTYILFYVILTVSIYLSKHGVNA